MTGHYTNNSDINIRTSQKQDKLSIHINMYMNLSTCMITTIEIVLAFLAVLVKCATGG